MVDPSPGAQVFEGRYELLAKAGEGSFGTVFQARDLALDRVVALKLLRARKDAQYQQVLSRFQREVEVLMRFPHPALVPVLDARLDPPTPYLASTWMGGGDLRRWIRGGPTPAPTVARVGSRLARALGHLHGHGVLHRDVKPANVLVDARGEVFLADLGLGRIGADSDLTATGEVVGTLHYLPPEALQEAQVVAAGDLFALGAVLLELVQGELLDGATMDPEALAVRLGKVEPPGLRAALRHCLRSHPESRPASGEALAERLLEVAREETLELADPADRGPHAAPESSDPGSGGPRRRGIPGAWLGVAALAVALLATRGRPDPAAPPTRAPPGTEANTAASPFGGDTESALFQELDDALRSRVPGRGPSAAEGGVRFLELLSTDGVAALDSLPAQGRVFDWMAAHRGVAELPPASRQTLRAYDQAYGDLGFPPVFRPLLEAAPWTGALPSISLRDPYHRYCLDQLDLDESRPGARWRRAAWVHLAAALEELENLDQRIQAGEIESARFPPFVPREEANLAAAIYLLRGTEDGRQQTRILQRKGLRATRDFLVAAARALDEADPPGGRDDADAFLLAGRLAYPFLYGTLITATPRRLFGQAPATEAGLFFQAGVVNHLGIQLRQMVVAPPAPGDLHLSTQEAALEACRAAGYHPHAEPLWNSLQNALRAEGRAARLQALLARHGEALRATMSPAFVADFLFKNQAWARSATAAPGG